MTGNQDPTTTAEMAVLLRISDDYESLCSIGKFWDENIPMPPVGEMLRILRELQLKGWVQSYRYEYADPFRFIPIDRFGDEEAMDSVQLTTAATLWWLATKSGLAALDGDEDATEGRADGDIGVL